MNEPNATPGEPGTGKSGFGVSLMRTAEVLYAPVEMFRKMTSQWGWSDWMVPILVGIVISMVVSGMIWPQLDMLTAQREALEARGIAQEQIETQMAATEQFFNGPLGNLLKFSQIIFYPATLALLALIFWGGASVMSGRISFGRTFSVVAYAWFPKVLEGILLIFVLQGREQVRADRLASVMATNPAYYLDVSQAGTPLYALFSSLNPFTLWSMALIALGLASVGKMSRGGAFMVVGGLFALWLVIQAGWAAVS